MPVDVPRPLRILAIEHRPAERDREKVAVEPAAGLPCVADRWESTADAIARLAGGAVFDLAVLALDAAETDGCAAIGHLRAVAPGLPVVLASPDVGRMAEGLAPPGRGFMELSASGLADLDPRCPAAIDRGGLCLSVTTASAWTGRVVPILAHALARHYGGRDVGDAELCLSEAVANGILHGNLGIDGDLRGAGDRLRIYGAAVAAALADPERAARRLEITAVPVGTGGLELCVIDHGDGFDPSALSERDVPAAIKHGRGLSLIRKVARAVAIGDGGRTITITL
jgi:anti-sigma regulatory factor (Ser/Thr protein kinase)/CheY-like chemotaxis protein